MPPHKHGISTPKLLVRDLFPLNVAQYVEKMRPLQPLSHPKPPTLGLEQPLHNSPSIRALKLQSFSPF